jgi:hypothetical protein
MRGGLSFSFRCLVCDLAFQMGLSEDEFYDRYNMPARAQLVATYRSQLDRQSVMSITPQKAQG